MEKLTSLSVVEKFPSVHFHRFEISSAFITPMHQCIHAEGIDQCNASLTKDQVTVKFKTLPSDFKKLLRREKPQMNQLGLRSLLDDDASK